MSTSRYGKEPPVERGPNGRRLCRWCRTEVPPRRQVYCSEPCRHEWSIRAYPSYMRELVSQRDKGVCALCGLDTRTLRRPSRLNQDYDRLMTEWKVKMVSLGFPAHCRDRWRERSLWEADHIIPVVEGGGECDLSNIRTLCVPCHQKVTAELAARRALQRREEANAKAVNEAPTPAVCQLQLDGLVA